MAEPRIQYCTTSDGVSIAYSAIGEGVPFVYMPTFPIGHLQVEWQIPMIRRWYERLAATRMLVRYDARGIGLSERDVTEFSVDARMRDLDALVDRLNLEKFALFGALHSGPVAIAYAARHPERVSHLILWCTFARASDWAQSAQVQATRSLVEQDWEMFTETASRALGTGWEAGDAAHQVAKLYQESVTKQTFVVAHPSLDQVEVTELLPQVKASTLVVHSRQLTQLAVDVARGLAARIPDARLAFLERGGMFPYVGDQDEALQAIDEFLGDAPSANQPAPAAPSAFRTVLFTDLVGHTEMMSRLGDERGRDVLREHERITREVLKANGGTEVKTMGDGFMASFGSVTKAVECAVALQRAFDERNQQTDKPTNLAVRCGLNAGEPIEEDGDLFGATVILASRIAAKADGGEILVADTVRGLCSGKGFLFADRGEFVAKGFEEPVRVYEVQWRH
jgi:class 3 adenylate cyclase